MSNICRQFNVNDLDDENFEKFTSNLSSKFISYLRNPDKQSISEFFRQELKDVQLFPEEQESWETFRQLLFSSVKFKVNSVKINPNDANHITMEDVLKRIPLNNPPTANLLQSFATQEAPTRDSTDNTTNVIQNNVPFDTPTETYDKKFLNKAYGNVTQAMQRAEVNATKGFVSAFLINRGLFGQAGLITPDLLNNSVRQYQNYLLDKIKTYLKLDNNKEDPKLDTFYSGVSGLTTGDTEVKYNNVMQVLKSNYSQYLQMDENTLRDLYQTASGLKQGDSEAATRRLDAYEAWVILNNFDSMLKYLFGKSISIQNQDTMFNVFTGTDKYHINNIADQMNKSWRPNEEFFLDQEISRLNQRLIESTPLLDEYGNPTNNYIRFQDFVSLVGNIRDLTYNSETSRLLLTQFTENQRYGDQLEESTKIYIEELRDKIFKNQNREATLRDLLSYMILDSQRGFAAVVDVLNNDLIWKTETVSLSRDPRLNINLYKTLLRSIKQGITSYDSATSMHKVTNDSMRGLPVDTETYYSAITQTTLSILKNKFLQCYTDSDGRIFIRTLNDNSIQEQVRYLTENFEARNNRATAFDNKATHFVSIVFNNTLPGFEVEQSNKTKVTYDPRNFNSINDAITQYVDVLLEHKSKDEADKIRTDILQPTQYSIELNLRQGSNNPKTFYAIIHPYQPNSFVTFASDVAGNVPLDIENFLGLDDNLMTREQFLDLVGPNNFIENVLNLNLYRNPNLLDALLEDKAYRDIFGNIHYGNLALDLIKLATTIYSNYQSQADLLNGISKPDLDSYEALAVNIFGEHAPKYNMNTGDLHLLYNTDQGHVNEAFVVLKRVAEAKAKAEGLGRSSVVKGADQASLGNNTLSRLIGNVLNQIDIQCKNNDSATKDTILVQNPEVLEGYYKIHEATIRGNDKRTTQFNEAELTSACFSYAFLDGLVAKDTDYQTLGGGHCGLLASVNSDKSFIDFMMVNLNAKAPDGPWGKGKTFLQLIGINGDKVDNNVFQNNFEELRLLIQQQMSQTYTKILNSIRQDYGKLFSVQFPPGSKEARHNRLLSVLSQYVNQRGLLMSGIYEHNFQEVKDTLRTQGFSGLTDESFKTLIDDLLLDYNQVHRFDPIQLYDQMHTTKGKYVANDTLLHIIDRFSNGAESSKFWRIKEAELFRGLILDNFEYNLEGYTKDKHKKVETLLRQATTNRKPWIDPYSDKLILGYIEVNVPYARDSSRNPVHQSFAVTSKSDIAQIEQQIREIEKQTGTKVFPSRVTEIQGVPQQENNTLELLDQARTLYNNHYINLEVNPFLKSWNLLDYLFTQQHLLTSVGTHLAHPGKGARISNQMDSTERALAVEAARYFAQHKRNVSLTAAMHEFQLNQVNGIPSVYNVATIEDINDTLTNILGTIDRGVKPFDGATFVHPLMVRWENYSLGSEKAGNSKKQYVHAYEERTAQGIMIKTCGFGITNALIRDQVYNVIAVLLRKMMNHHWMDKDGYNKVYDISKDALGHELGSRYHDIYYYQDGKYYRRSFDKQHMTVTPELTNGVATDYIYEFVDEEVGNNGVPIEGAKPNRVKIQGINNNWDAYQKIFKGQYCYDIIRPKSAHDSEDGLLHYSETSLDNLLIMANNMGDVEEGVTLIETQDQIWQPAKHSDIHYLVTAGAIKQGAANINSAQQYDFRNPKELNTQRVNANQIGIQLDKEHNADSEDISIMNQVLQACSERGFSEDKAHQLYQTLFTLTRLGIKDQMDSFREFLQIGNGDNTAQAYNEFRKTMEYIVKKAILQAGPRDGNLINNIARAMDAEIKSNPNISIKNTDFGIPYSDSGIFARLNTIVSAFINRSGIRQKLDGVLSVLNPSYSIKRKHGKHSIEYYRPEDSVEYQYKIMDHYGFITNMSVNAPRMLVDLQNQPNTLDGPEEFIVPGDLRRSAYNFAKNVTLGAFYEVVESKGVSYNVLIQTPPEYQQLKERIMNGEIQSLKENYVLGRELAHYNVVYEDTEGNIYNMYDLAPSKLLFELKPFIKEYKNAADKVVVANNYKSVLVKVKDFLNLNSQNLKNLTENSNITAREIPEIDALVYGQGKASPSVDVILRRHLQKSLFAITKEKTSNVEYYNALLDFYNNYDMQITSRKAQNDLEMASLPEDRRKAKENEFTEMSKTLGLNDLKAIIDKYDPGRSIQVTNVIEARQDLLDELERNIRTYVYDVDNNLKKVQINKDSIYIKPYEVVMPKIYKSLLSLNSQEDLQSIVNDKLFFLNKLNKTFDVKTDKYTYAFKRLNGNHVYVLDKDRLEAYKGILQKLDIKKSPDRKDNTYKRLGFDNSVLGNMYYDVDAQGNFVDDEVYTDGIVEIIVSSNPAFYRDKLNYSIIDVNQDNVVNVDRAIDFFTGAFDSPNQSAKNWINYLGMNKTALGQFKYAKVGKDRSVSQAAKEAVFTQMYDAKAAKQRAYWDKYLQDEAIKLHTSFLASLGIVAARIPAQYQASFMPMVIVDFDTEDVNSAYVSTSQIWLQGSDYDVDAVSLASYSLNRSGILEHWSRYANFESLPLFEASNNMPFPTGEKAEIQTIDLSNEALKRMIAPGESYIGERDIQEFRNFQVSRIKQQWELLKNLVKRAIQDGSTESKQAAFALTNKGKLYVRNGVNIMQKLRHDFNGDYNQLVRSKEYFYAQTDALRQIQDLCRVFNFYSEYGILDLMNDEVEVNENGKNMSLTEAMQQKVNQNMNVTYEDVWRQLIDRIDYYNDYINQVSEDSQILMAKNSVMNGMHNIALRPENLIQAQTPIDEAYQPFLAKSDSSAPARDLATFTPGNVENKIRAIIINQVGKDCIGISAVGTKAFSAWTAYCNHLLNRGAGYEQRRILVKKEVNDELKKAFDPNGDFSTLANIRPQRMSSVIAALVDNVKKRNQDIDAIVNIASMLTLATDNAKLLGLNNLNAGRNLIGMYLYALSMGVDFNAVANLMTSDLGLIIRDLTNGNIFDSNNSGMSSVSQALSYLTIGPKKLINQNRQLSEHVINQLKAELKKVSNNPIVEKLKTFFENAPEDIEDFDFIGRLAHYGLNENIDHKVLLMQKFAFLDNLKENPFKYANEVVKNSTEVTDEGKERERRDVISNVMHHNQFINELKNYIYQVSQLRYKLGTSYIPQLDAFNVLTQGADEMKSLGAILSSNNGVKTKINEELAFMRRIEALTNNRHQAKHEENLRKWYLLSFKDRETRDKPRSQENRDKLDFPKFMANPVYRQEQINLYERNKHSVNILDLIDKVPHFHGYLQAIALDYAGKKAMSTKFRALEEFGNKALELHGATRAKDIEQIYNRTLDLISDKIRLKWLKTLNLELPIEPLQYYLNDKGELVQNKSSNTIYIPVTTEIGEGNFKFWMEHYVIPYWTNGFKMSGASDSMLRSNQFLRGLQLVITDRTPLNLHAPKYTLGINMSPRDAIERGILDNYRGSFNNLELVNEYATFRVGNDFRQIGIQDLFWLYNQNVNLGKPGEHNLTSIFDDFADKSALVKSFNAFVHEMDINPALDLVKDVDITQNELIGRTALRRSKYQSNLTYIYPEDPRILHYALHRKISKGIQTESDEMAFEEASDAFYSSDLNYERVNIYVDPTKYNYQYLLRGISNKRVPSVSWQETINVNVSNDRTIGMTVTGYNVDGVIQAIELTPSRVAPLTKVLYGLPSIRKLPNGPYREVLNKAIQAAGKLDNFKSYNQAVQLINEVMEQWKGMVQEGESLAFINTTQENILKELASKKDFIDQNQYRSYDIVARGTLARQDRLPDMYIYDGLKGDEQPVYIPRLINGINSMQSALLTNIQNTVLTSVVQRNVDGLTVKQDLTPILDQIEGYLHNLINCT